MACFEALPWSPPLGELGNTLSTSVPSSLKGVLDTDVQVDSGTAFQRLAVKDWRVFVV